MRISLIALATIGWTLGSAAQATVQAQGIEQRVRRVDDGTVIFRYTARPGVCGDGRTFIMSGRNTIYSQGMNFTHSNGHDDWRRQCEPGPARVELSVHNGEVDNVHAFVGPDRSMPANATDLGTISARDASRYLLDLASRADGRVGEKAIFPAILADSSTPWPTLFAIARDSSNRPRATRNNAFFWLGRAAAASVNHEDVLGGGNSDDDDRSDVANSAVFALSQLKHHEGVEPLIEVARTNKNPRVRSQALFWLGESHDPRALALFEEILR